MRFVLSCFSKNLSSVHSPTNARKLAASETTEVLLHAFASETPLKSVRESKISLKCALCRGEHQYHSQLSSVIQNIALSSLSHQELRQWIQNILAPSYQQRPILLNGSKSPSSHLLELLIQIGAKNAERFNGAPLVLFETITDGFAYLQIPEVQQRVASSTTSSNSGNSSTIITQKTWPPSDGYSVTVWFRIDTLEKKEDREDEYRRQNSRQMCILCQQSIKDEYALKCSHRACRGCHEALLNSGGECVVCNPPSFYLFRFRSGDGKSVTEVFVKGTRIYMRTSSGRSICQFSHPPLEEKKWYHATFSHSRQRFQSSVVTFYLNGLHQETVKISYPSSVSSGQPLSGLIGVPPQTRRKSKAAWSLGPFFLFDEPANGHAANIMYAAGPSYDDVFYGAFGNGEIPLSLELERSNSLFISISRRCSRASS
jgi:hypothetical protein